MPERRTRTEMVEATRGKLISTARRAFASRGFAHTSMVDLTSEAGLTRGALYHHFGGKEGLLLAVIYEIEAEVGARLQAVSDASPTRWDSFRNRCRKYLELSLEPEIRRIILQDTKSVFGSVPPQAQSVGMKAIQGELDLLVKDGLIAPVHTEVLSRMLYGVVAESSFWIAEPDGNSEDRLEYALNALDRLLDGLKNKTEIIANEITE